MKYLAEKQRKFKCANNKILLHFKSYHDEKNHFPHEFKSHNIRILEFSI